jgi:UDP-glucose 4-epimerase
VRYLITGGSGYLGSRLVGRLAARERTERVIVADLRPPRAFTPKVAYEELDVRDRERARRLVEHERPDVLVHLAFVLNPIHDEQAMYEIDVGGTQNILEAASAAGTEHVLVTSSTTAYGAFADNPVPLTEDHPVRGVPDFEYARDKAESDRLCQLWRLEHPNRTMTIVRPCIVFGPGVDNYIVRSFTDQPFFADLGGEPPIQFVHEDDVVEALLGLLDGRHGGAFNVAPDDWMTVRECAELIGLRRVPVPFGAYRALAQVLWRLRRTETPGGNLHFVRHPWVASNERIKGALGWAPRFSSRETFELTMRARGVELAGATTA